MRPLRAVLLAVMMVAFGGASGAAAQTEPPPDPDPTFGAVETYHAPDMADEAGVGWTRLVFYWSELERDGPGTWNEFHAPLAWMDRAQAGGREVIGVIQSTPEWATDGSAGAGVPRGLYLPIDDPDNLWATFIREVVSRYEGRVDRWVIWNEPDITPGTYGALWEGSTEDYVQLLKVAYLAAHEVNPDVHIHLGGTTYWHDPGWLREFLSEASTDPDAAEHGYFFDVVTLHIYFRPETTLGIVADTRAALSEYGLEKPIWINETNAMPFDDPAQPWEEPVFRVTQAQQADFFLQQFALALSMDVERIAAFKWVEEPPRPPGYEPFALIRTDRSARPALSAYEVITAHYSSTTDALRVERPDHLQVVLARGEQTTRVIWARTETSITVDVPALAGSAIVVDSSGAETTITARRGVYRLDLPGAVCFDECLMGGPPLVLVENAPTPLTDADSLAARVSTLPIAQTNHAGASAPRPAMVAAGTLTPVVVLVLFLGGVMWLRRHPH